MESMESNENTCDEGDLKEEDCSCFTLVSFDPDDELITEVLEKTDTEKPVRGTNFGQTPARTRGQKSNTGSLSICYCTLNIILIRLAEIKINLFKGILQQDNSASHHIWVKDMQPADAAATVVIIRILWQT